MHILYAPNQNTKVTATIPTIIYVVSITLFSFLPITKSTNFPLSCLCFDTPMALDHLTPALMVNDPLMPLLYSKAVAKGRKKQEF